MLSIRNSNFCKSFSINIFKSEYKNIAKYLDDSLNIAGECDEMAVKADHLTADIQAVGTIHAFANVLRNAQFRATEGVGLLQKLKEVMDQFDMEGSSMAGSCPPDMRTESGDILSGNKSSTLAKRSRTPQKPETSKRANSKTFPEPGRIDLQDCCWL